MDERPNTLLPNLDDLWSDALVRHEYGRLVASTARRLGAGRLDDAEDIVQEAFLRAVRFWPCRGVPASPVAWLVQVAKRLTVDAVRGRGQPVAHELDDHGSEDRGLGAVDELDDDSLGLLFLCCHPELAPRDQVALMLKTVAGFGVDQIARALWLQPSTLAQRLVRAKEKLRLAGARFEAPGSAERAERLPAVLDGIYLIFNEGWCASEGELLCRPDLLREALRCARGLLCDPGLDTPRVHALLALSYLLVARLRARTDPLGRLLTLDVQDRSLWDRTAITLGFRHFERSLVGAELSAFHVEASIAATHASASSYEVTDWSAILADYDRLLTLRPSPFVALNRIVALAKVRGMTAALRELDAVEAELAGQAARNYLVCAVRGQLLAWGGDQGAAHAAYREALATGGGNEAERSLLRRRLSAS